MYIPYGAYELKATYQRNFLKANVIVSGSVILLTIIYLLAAVLSGDDAIDLTGKVIKTVADLGPPPSVAQKPPQVQVVQPDITLPKVGIPKPVADDELLDEDVVLATREELADIQAPDVGSDEGVRIEIEEDFIPASDEFVPVEIMPELIFKNKPEYPRMVEQAGLEGTVYLRVLVKKDGTVGDAKVEKSSKIESLDEAALKAVYACTFKPAIQNGRPVNVWVSFPYEFTLIRK
jgi:protein TonB